MKVDFTKPLISIGGVELKGPKGESGTLGYISVEALLAPEDGIDGSEKLSRWKLAQTIHKAAEPIEVTIEDVAKLKQCVGKNFHAAVIGPAWEALES